MINTGLKVKTIVHFNSHDFDISIAEFCKDRCINSIHFSTKVGSYVAFITYYV